jgi:ArsR family transcriptional regulator
MRKPPALYKQMSVLADPLRSRLLLVLERNELSVGELCSVVQSPQSTVSRHLKALSDAAWVTSRSEGTERRYAMVAAGLDPTARSLWLLVRKEAAEAVAALHDEKRLAHVLSERRTRSQEFFSAGASQWDGLRDELFGRRFFLPGLLALLDDEAVVADLGCGTGAVAETLSPFVAKVIGVDGSPAMLRAAKKRLEARTNVELRHGTLERLPIEDATLDAATMFLVLHHVVEPARALAEAARTLQPGGRIVLVDMFPHDREEYRARMGHVWLGFPQAEIERLLGTTGFDGVHVVPLPADPKAKGPALFAARAVKRRAASVKTRPRLVSR